MIQPTMKTLRLVLAGLGFAVVAFIALAQEQSGTPPQGAAAPGQSPAEAAPAPADESGDVKPGQDAAPQAGQSPAPGSEDDEFIPSEEIPADEEVTFPVNI